MVRELLAAGAEPASVGIGGQSPLELAVVARSVPTIHALLAHGRETGSGRRRLRGWRAREALVRACEEGAVAVVEELLDGGVPPTRAAVVAAVPQDSTGTTELLRLLVSAYCTSDAGANKQPNRVPNSHAYTSSNTITP